MRCALLLSTEARFEIVCSVLNRKCGCNCILSACNSARASRACNRSCMSCSRLIRLVYCHRYAANTVRKKLYSRSPKNDLKETQTMSVKAYVSFVGTSVEEL